MHVGHLVDVIPHRTRNGPAGKGFPARPSDELQGGWRRNDLDRAAILTQAPNQLARLVGGDAATYTQYNEPIAQDADSSTTSSFSIVNKFASISRNAIDNGFSCRCVSTNGPTCSSRPSLSCE